MNIVEGAMSKLNSKNILALVLYYCAFHNAKTQRKTFYAEKFRSRIWGYLECLKDAEIISPHEKQILFDCFTLPCTNGKGKSKNKLRGGNVNE